MNSQDNHVLAAPTRRHTLSRRDLLKGGGAAVAGLALLNSPTFLRAASAQQVADDTVIPWLDQPPENPIPDVLGSPLQWEAVEEWITPNDQFFSISHFGQPEIEADAWQLEITGRVGNPMTLTLEDLKARTRQELLFTIECAGNHGFDWFTGGIGNARWAGTSVLALLKEAEVLDDGIEVVFFGEDVGEMEVREQTIRQPFARSMSLEDAMNPQNLVCYEMNDEPLPQANGFPARLIAPGWYGVANVKWLKRIEVMNTRFAGHFMARDYVTLREEQHGDEAVWVESVVGRSRIKSVPVRVVHTEAGHYRIEGAAWGAPLQRVEVQIDDGSWQRATIDWSQYGRFAWKFWTLEWKDVTSGEHAIRTRAIDAQGNVQPTQDDPQIANKVTYWESNGQVTRFIEIPV